MLLFSILGFFGSDMGRQGRYAVNRSEENYGADVRAVEGNLESRKRKSL